MKINTVYTSLVFFSQIDWNLALISYHNISTGIKHCLQNTVQGLFYFIFFKSEADLIKKTASPEFRCVCLPNTEFEGMPFLTSLLASPPLIFSFPYSSLFSLYSFSKWWCHCFFIFWSSKTYLLHSIKDQLFIEKHQMVLHHNNVLV